MAKGSLTPDERAELGDFIAQLIQGKAKLGLGSMGMLGLYGRAQEQGLSLIEILGDSPQVLTWAGNLLHTHARRIPRATLDILRLVVKAADNPPKAPAATSVPAHTVPAGLNDDV